MSELKTYTSHFCGVGGACLGLHQAGLKCVRAIDFWQPALDTRELNLKDGVGVCSDISKYEFTTADVADVLWTSPVCQTFSISSREQYGTPDTMDDTRNDLYYYSLQYLIKFKPKYFILENVVGLLTHDIDYEGGGTLSKWIREFRYAGYNVEWNVVDSLDFGLPQNRERVILVGSRDGNKGLIPKNPKLKKKPCFGDIRDNRTGICEQAAWGGQTYKTAFAKVARTGVPMRIITDEDILPTVTCGWGGGATRKKVGIVDDTLLNQHEGYHPDSVMAFLRHPTVLEGSRAQGFPDTWEWPANPQDAWRMVGNAVSPPVAKALIEHLKLVEAGEKPPARKALPKLKRGGKLPTYIKESNGEDFLVSPFELMAEESETE